MTTKEAYKPSAALIVREHGERVFYEAKFRHNGKQVLRRIGPAWLTRSASGEWAPRRGRVPDGYLDRSRATVRAAELVAAHTSGAEQAEKAERERREHGPTFREVAAAYLQWLERVRGREALHPGRSPSPTREARRSAQAR